MQSTCEYQFPEGKQWQGATIFIPSFWRDTYMGTGAEVVHEHDADLDGPLA